MRELKNRRSWEAQSYDVAGDRVVGFYLLGEQNQWRDWQKGMEDVSGL